MRIVAFTLAHWSNDYQAALMAKALDAWEKHVHQIIDVTGLFVCCGTMSLKSEHTARWNVVQAEAALEGGYCNNRSYSACAMSIALAYALTHYDCDMVMNLAWDGVVGHDLRPFAKELMHRPELIMASNWVTCFLEDNFYLLKRSGIAHYLNHRMRPNIVSHDFDILIPEREMAMIFDGRWWNPFPVRNHCRIDAIDWIGVDESEVIRDWPILIRPSATLRDKFLQARFI